MKLRDLTVLLLDCQTTGMRASSSHILEIAWAKATANDAVVPVESYLLQLPNGETIPERVTEITGIRDEDLGQGVSEAEMFESLRHLLGSLTPAVSVIHYAQFEKPFLQALFDRRAQPLSLEIVCSHRIAKRLFQGLPSQNIRGMAGFFGSSVTEFKRAKSHVTATAEIWRAIVGRLEEQGVTTLEELRTWLIDKPKSKAKAVPYQYRMDRRTRLALSPKPGVYRMLAKDGTILYVGKATSLRSRVNSYFRGQKNRDRRKLEMLAQVWDLQVTECETPLEAALLETDEIKRWDPPYNVSLKAKSRELVFYSEDFSSQSAIQDEVHRLGPFRPMDSLGTLFAFRDWLRGEAPPLMFYEPIDEALLCEGFELFRVKEDLPELPEVSARELLAVALRSLRKFRAENGHDDLEQILARLRERDELGTADLEEPEKMDYSPEDIAGKFHRLFLRAAQCTRRVRQLTQLLNARVLVRDRVLKFSGGHLNQLHQASRLPWAKANIADFDRMSVLLSEIRKHRYKVEFP